MSNLTVKFCTLVVTTSWDTLESEIWPLSSVLSSIFTSNPDQKIDLAKQCLSPEERDQYFLPKLTDEQWIERGCPHYASEF